MIAYPELAAIRLGYGLSPLMAAPVDPAQVLASVAGAGPDADAISVASISAMQRDLVRLRRRAKAGDRKARAQADDIGALSDRMIALAQRREMARALDAPAGFGERLVRFWSDHFTVRGGNSERRLLGVSLVDEAIRPHLGGSFADMMFAAETHPAMLLYLSQQGSVGPNSRFARKRGGGLNENLAREMIELHSLGVGADYTQADVRQLAELLTGLRYHRDRGIFDATRAEPGPETVLGRRYGDKGPASLDDIRAVITDLAARPETARHLARKLVVHFVSDDPPQGLVDRLAATYSESGGDLAVVNAALAQAPELAARFREKARQPYDFVIAALRSLGFTGRQLLDMKPGVFQRGIIRPMALMGQNWGAPRGPDGWPEAAHSWITPQGLAARIHWSAQVLPRLHRVRPEPREFLAAAFGDTASEPLKWAVPRVESVRDAIVIALSSADFNRR